MLTDSRTLAKLEKIEQLYADLRFETIAPVPVQICETTEYLRAEPGNDAGWTDAPPGTRWGGSWVTAWFRGDITLPEECAGAKVFVRAKTDGETLFVVDGRHQGVFDGNHPLVCMTTQGEAGKTYHLAFEAYAGHTFPGTQPYDSGPVVGDKSKTFGGIEVCLEREDVSAFVADLRVLRQLTQTLDDNSLRKGKIVPALAQVFATVDAMPSESGEASWRPKLASAREIMQPLLELHNGPTTPWIGLVGHSHIDTAWLWPLAETWRKCARTFSSCVNLLDQYPEFIFLQTAPCHAEVVRSEYPDIFERMQQHAREGRWEPNGAMWVEPDCNLTSGEAFVRQLLVGQRATREMFGYTSDTLWLPDVFGYSAALPQILQGCGVEFFCTSKIAWNDTTRFPYDTFTWQGIDGSTVLAHYTVIQGWPDPVHLADQWNWIQHKDAQDRRLFPIGYGDGGGGPMAEMIEIARRVTDLEGCPRSSFTTVSDFMKSVRDDMGELPRHVGELYLECHRGTLTSVSDIKKGNRKTELALREAEFLATLAATRGEPYPAENLLDLWKVLLTNQFHDILPGSSIARVNDEAIETFSACIDEARSIRDRAIETLACYSPDEPPVQLLVTNSLSWDRAGEIAIGELCDDAWPVDPGIMGQRIETIEGKRDFIISGDSFGVSGDTVETPFALVTFDGTGRIVSFIERSSGRELVPPGGALNSFLCGEDVPLMYDNWDIDSDYELKLALQDHLVRREVVAEGPLQIRIEVEYEIGEGSRLTQHIIFHSTTPRVDFETKVDWHEKHKILKTGFDLDILADSARHEIQYGHVERPTHRNLPQDRARFEVCAHKWTDLSENGFGVALLNDCKYGISVHGSELRLTLLRSGTHPDPRGDEGTHVFTYALLPHAEGFSVPAVVRPAYELNIPPIVCPATAAASAIDSLVSIDADSVIVESVKWAEDGGGFVIRLYEAEKTGCMAGLQFGVPVTAVAETNMLEEDRRELDLDDGGIVLRLRPFEIKTLYCTL